MKHLSYYLTLSLLICILGSCSSDEIIENPSTTSELKKSELSALQAGNNLMESFKKGVTRSSTKEMDYPDNYGGCYLNQDGRLVILTVGDTTSLRTTFDVRTKSNNYILKSCKYTYNELVETMNKLNKIFLNESQNSIINEVQLHSFALSDSANCILVRLGEFTPTKVDQFKCQIMDSPTLAFCQSKGIPVIDSAPEPGGSLGYNSGSQDASMGYRATRYGEDGFVTAGHFVGVGGSVYQGYDLVGYCANSQTSGTIDAAWCSAINYTPSNTTPSGTRLTGRVGGIFMYATAYMEGMESRYSYGNITNTNATSEFRAPTHNYRLTNIVETTYTGRSGDSGGIVYSSSNDILGIHTGHNGSISYFTKADEINSEFNLSPY